jgi:hypothetical protein
MEPATLVMMMMPGDSEATLQAQPHNAHGHATRQAPEHVRGTAMTPRVMSDGMGSIMAAYPYCVTPRAASWRGFKRGRWLCQPHHCPTLLDGEREGGPVGGKGIEGWHQGTGLRGVSLPIHIQAVEGPIKVGLKASRLEAATLKLSPLYVLSL